MYKMPHVVFGTDAARAPEVALLLSQISGLSRVSHYLAPHSASSTKGHSHACEVLSVNKYYQEYAIPPDGRASFNASIAKCSVQ